MFDTLVHADWSVDPKKRWMAVARRSGAGWLVGAPVTVARDRLVQELFGHPGGRLTGFDFPVGVPASYGARTGLRDFPELLRTVGEGEWEKFFDVADAPADISMQRPFYPRSSRKGVRRAELYGGLGVAGMTELLRDCERAGNGRRAACSLFWTLGGNQVGKAALTGWREAVRPALAQGARLWPFEGNLAELARPDATVICETYPAEAYGHIGIGFGPRESKRRQADRAGKAGALMVWAEKRNVMLCADAQDAVISGFGSRATGEDAFDALTGLLGMIEVVDGHRPEGAPTTGSVRRWEGWILGMPALPERGVGQ